MLDISAVFRYEQPNDQERPMAKMTIDVPDELRGLFRRDDEVA
jgi:hypothetical protein